MTPPRRRTAYYVAGLVGAIGAGFASHFVVPLTVKEAPAAQVQAAPAAPESPTDTRLRAIEAKQEAMLLELRDIRETLGFVRGRLSIESTK